MQTRLTHYEHELLDDLRDHMESEPLGDYRTVYLSNCTSYGKSWFRGVLGSLTKKGYYSPIPGESAFGDVLMNGKDPEAATFG